MLRYMIRRTLFMILVLIVISIFTFIVFVKLPTTDPAIRVAGKHPTAAQLRVIRHSLGLDRSVFYQYWGFAKGLIPWPGLFLNRQVYFSWYNRVAVHDEIFSRLPVTLALTVGGAIMWLLMGIPIGIISAIKPGTLIDRAAMIFALVGVSAPVFFLALVLLYLFHFTWHIAPSSGIPPGESVIGAVLKGDFVLPWISLAVTSAAFYSRMVRGNLMETMSEDYIRTARSKGLSERRVIYKHGLRSALTPVVTMFGMDVAFLLGGAVITESVFQLPGLGQYTIQALYSADFPAVMGVTVLGAFFIVIANLVVDILYAFLDPRVRYT
ncbi:MAG: ABC transporter permease [Actinobacteria bacterium]|nr:ABC transporter permease [Actinomycetota bacterium]